MDLLLASGLMMGAHEMGHQAEADRQGVPLNWRETGIPFYKTWRAENPSPTELSRIAGAGFRAQDTLSDTTESSSVRIASALNKLGYSVFPKGIRGKGGDVSTLNKAKGKTYMREALALSALMDLYKAKNPKTPWGLNFWQSQSGTPGLTINRRF